MADRNREEYNERERRWRRRNEGEGFFDRVGNWLSGDDQDRDRQDNWQRERGYNRRNDRTYDQNASRYANRGPARSYGQDYDQDFDRNRNRDSEWERTRQWRQGGDREAGYNRQGQYGQNRNTSSDRYGQNYGRDRDYGYGEDFDYASDYGRSYNQGNRRYSDYNQEVNRDYDRDYAGDWESRRDRDFYGSGEYEQINRRYGQGRRYGQNFGRGYNRGQQVRSAGMGTDFNPEVNYENRDYDFGYESEGAFYQDLDEPAGYSYYEVWMIPGEFTGMGPSGYQRTDDRIFEDVCEYLTQHGRIDPSDVEVQVNNGEVTLTGTVPTREMKRLAEDSVDSISGVKDIHNEIKVRHQDREQDWRRDSGEDWDRQRSQTSYSARGGDRTAGGGTVAEGGVGTAAGAAATSSTASERRTDASRSAAGETTMGAGLTSEGSTSTGTGKRSQVMQGMEVIGKDGKVVGRVKEVRSNDFLVDRDMARDVFIPFDALQSVGAQAMLNIAAEDVDDQEWEKPDLL